MTSVRIIRHEKVEGTGSYEVRVSTFFHFENVASRRLRPQEQKTREEALADASTTRQEQNKLKSGSS